MKKLLIGCLIGLFGIFACANDVEIESQSSKISKEINSEPTQEELSTMNEQPIEICTTALTSKCMSNDIQEISLKNEDSIDDEALNEDEAINEESLNKE